MCAVIYDTKCVSYCELWSKKFESYYSRLYLGVVIKYGDFEGLFTCL